MTSTKKKLMFQILERSIMFDEWGTEPIDEADYQKWLSENNADFNELSIEYYPFTEENILLFAE